MQEIKLKFQIPPEKRELIFKTLQRKAVLQKKRCAQYFDTAEFSLAQEQLSLRQHFENGCWKQTFKAPTEQQIQRFELDQNISAPSQEIILDQFKKNKTIPKKVRRILNQLKQPVLVQFETNIDRSMTLFNFQNSQIEIALDRGQIVTSDAQQTFEIYEIEFELKHGTIEDLISFVLPRIKRYGLWLDIRSKAQQGFYLAQNIQEIPVNFQHTLNLEKNNTPEQALQKMINNCLQHLLPNSTAIALEHFNSEHVHQARVAIRRLRSALKTFANWSQYIDPTWETQLVHLFQLLGASRDLTLVNEELLPRLQSVGSPAIQPLTQHEDHSQNLSEAFKSLDFSNLILSLMQFIYRKSNTKKSKSLIKSTHKKLENLLLSIHSDADHYLDLEIDARHKTRKRLKRLRYSIEFVACLYEAKTVKQFLKAIKPVQNTLGLYNDLIVAEELLRPQLGNQTQIWFALGWIAAEKQRLLLQSQQELQQFRQCKHFWA